jgi:5-hydroxyisourate hydrolase-like protein (transthyretin family)
MALKILLALFLAALMVSGLAFGCFGGVNAASIPKPSVPEFTVSVTDHSYDVQTTTTTNTDFDGRITTTTTPGYHMVNGSIELSIKNQPFTSYYDSDGYPIN